MPRPAYNDEAGALWVPSLYQMPWAQHAVASAKRKGQRLQMRTLSKIEDDSPLNIHTLEETNRNGNEPTSLVEHALNCFSALPSP